MKSTLNGRSDEWTESIGNAFLLYYPWSWRQRRQLGGYIQKNIYTPKSIDPDTIKSCTRFPFEILLKFHPTIQFHVWDNSSRMRPSPVSIVELLTICISGSIPVAISVPFYNSSVSTCGSWLKPMHTIFWKWTPVLILPWDEPVIRQASNLQSQL